MMDISNFFLTPEEYFQKRASIIEELKKIEIDIQYKNDHNFITQKFKENGKKDTKRYLINIQTPEDPHVDKKSAVYHELSHALWESFVGGGLNIMGDWADVMLDDLLEEEKIANIKNQHKPNNIPAHIAGTIGEAQASMKQYIRGIYTHTFNALEDQRIESLTREVWLATHSMFNNIRMNCGEDMTQEDIKTPVDNVLAARFFRPELTTQEYIDATDDVESTDKYGAIRIMQRLKPTIDEHIRKNLQHILKRMHKGIKTGKGLGATPEEREQEKRRQTGTSGIQGTTKAYKSRVERYAEAVKASGMTPEEQKEIKEKIKKYEGYIKSNEKIIPKEKPTAVQARAAQAIKEEEKNKKEAQSICNSVAEEQSKETSKKASVKAGQTSHEELQKQETPTHEECKAAQSGSIEESRSAALKEVTAILDKIVGNATPKIPAHMIFGDVARDSGTNHPDIQASTQLQKLFSKMKQSKRQHITEYGSEIDIEALIQAEEKGYGEFMIDEVKHRGLTVLVSIDGSGSMRNDYHISQARDLVATMFKAVERVPQVKVLANVWSSNDMGDVSITHIRTLRDCDKIALAHNYMYTPTHEAIKYSAKELATVHGKKLLIIVTDGHPQYHNKEGYPFSAQVLNDMCSKELRLARKFCRNVMCINISNEPESKRNLKHIFKKGYVEFEGMANVSDFVLKNFRRTVTQVLRN